MSRRPVGKLPSSPAFRQGWPRSHIACPSPRSRVASGHRTAPHRDRLLRTADQDLGGNGSSRSLDEAWPVATHAERASWAAWPPEIHRLIAFHRVPASRCCSRSSAPAVSDASATRTAFCAACRVHVLRAETRSLLAHMYACTDHYTSTLCLVSHCRGDEAHLQRSLGSEGQLQSVEEYLSQACPCLRCPEPRARPCMSSLRP